ncbi:MAG TPA: hypothetical protein VIY96_11130 [Thermoanaerobaculia bacterium]
MGTAFFPHRPFCGFLFFILVLAPLGCRIGADRKIADRILERYRHSTGTKPLPASQLIRMRLSPEAGGAGAGVAEVAWEPNRFRDRTSSAGATTERGIQGGKAYFTDEDGVTRVASEPVLRELLSRSYFWRRAWLFADRERAHVSLGPADATAVSVRLEPFGGNPLVLSFSRADGRLLSVRSPRFDLDFSGPRAFREASGRRPPVRGEIAWIGLLTDPIPDATVGGGCGRFAAGAGPVLFERTPDGGISFPARVNGAALRLSLDADTEGPAAISPERARDLSLPFSTDVFGRSIAAGATLEVGGFSCPGIHLQIAPAATAGSDGVIGAALFREAVVELDGKSGSLALHDPSRWVAPEGFTRVLVDDDGDTPVSTLRKKREPARLRVPSPTGEADLLLAPASAQRLDVAIPGPVTGLRWGVLSPSPLSAAPETRAVSPDWGDDGRLGFHFLLRFHAYLDMPHRWVYVRAAGE